MLNNEHGVAYKTGARGSSIAHNGARGAPTQQGRAALPLYSGARGAPMQRGRAALPCNKARGAPMQQVRAALPWARDKRVPNSSERACRARDKRRHNCL